MNNLSRNFILWVIVGLSLIILFNMFQGQNERVHRETIDFTTFQTSLNQEKIADVEMKNNVVNGRFTDGRLFMLNLPKDITLAQQLANRGIRVTASTPEDNSPSLFHVLLSWLPMLFLIGVWIFFIRQMQAGSNRALGFGRSKARLQSEKSTRVTFDDVAGIEEAKVELEEVVDFLKDPQKFQRLGGKIPKGVLLVGSPGTGKTLLARAIAGEARVPFFTISGSDFVEMFVGVGASRVRDMFEQAKKNAPCIVFIDEIDAVGRHRGAGLGGGNDEREQTLNQLLVEMDGFEANEGVILIAATNRPDVLDPALLRPGRFDRRIVVPMPDVKGREKILAVHMKNVHVAKEIDLKTLARGTPGFSGADLANLVNEAALLAARRNKRVVTMQEFEEAKDKVMMGSERRSLVMTDEEKRLTAYHEAGHAIVAFHSPASDPIHKATIIPRGRALGMVVRLPEGDRLSMPLNKIKADLAVAMGGRIAEELIFGAEKVTTGASSDIKHATEIARRIVTEWGLSPKLGPLTYGEPTQEVFLGHSVTQHKNISEATARVVDEEIRRIIDEAYDTAYKILTKYIKQLHKLAKALLEFETLSGEEVGMLLRGEPLAREPHNSEEKIRKRRASVPEAETQEPPKKLKPEPQPGI